MAKRLRVFSGVQPSGELHIGNYLGAIKNWVGLQQTHDCVYCVVDYHTITESFDPKLLRQRSLDAVLDLIACGIDPERSLVFIQSQVPEHTELAWVFACFTSYGDLQRMTQFKDKAQRAEFVDAGLFNYPVLQAADILLYQSERVPVGEDQVQHLELCRRIARRFNTELGADYFPEVEPILSPGSRIMSLADPTQKMSKSLGPNHYVALLEPEAAIQAKIRSAVTATGQKPAGQIAPGVANLLRLIQLTAPREVHDALVAEEKAGRLMYAELKAKVFEYLMQELTPVRERRARLTEADAVAVVEAGAERARAIAAQTMAGVRRLLGLF